MHGIWQHAVALGLAFLAAGWLVRRQLRGGAPRPCRGSGDGPGADGFVPSSALGPIGRSNREN